jgi:HAD superfamily hydrolase (TIGR01509 family)
VNRSPFDLVIFDCDGVLVDSEPIVNRVFVELVGEDGLALDLAATLREFSGGAMAARLAAIGARHGWPTPADFRARFDRRLAEAYARELRPVDGVAEVLRALPFASCVASNGSADEMRASLARAGLLAYFDPHLFSAAEVERPKPAPDVYLHAASRMGTAPSRCAVVEDSVPGVRAATAAGMAVYGYAALTSADALRDAGAKTLFARMEELPALLAG